MEFDNNITSIISTLSFLFHNVLKRGFNGVEVFRPEKKINLPVVLSRSEMECLLAALSGLPLFRSGFFTDAGCGGRNCVAFAYQRKQTVYGTGQSGGQVKCQVSHSRLRACKNMRPLVWDWPYLVSPVTRKPRVLS